METQTPEQRLEKAKVAMAVAEKELLAAKVEKLARSAMQLLRKSDNELWEICKALDWQAGVAEIYHDAQRISNRIASCLLGADERLRKLNKLDPDYWELKGEYKKESAGFTTDEAVVYSVATWVFARGFGRGDHADEMDSVQQKRFTELHMEAVVALGSTLADKGFAAWKAGNHDT